MYKENPIVQLFIESLESKDLFCVSPEKNLKSNKKVKIEYKDGSTSEFQTELSHDDFMKAWKEFCDWYRFIVQGQVNYIEDWTD